MPNKSLAKQWLRKAWHDLKSAQILYDAGHFTDSIGCDCQQAIEKMLKSLLAYENKKIKRTHDLVDIYQMVEDYIQFDEAQIRVLAIATDYYTEDKYPAAGGLLPEREEIKEVLDFAEGLLKKVCQVLEISKTDVEN